MDSFRKREAPTIWRAGRGAAPTAGLLEKIAKTTPCKVECLNSQHSFCFASGHEKKGGPSSRPNLIPSRSSRDAPYLSRLRGSIGRLRRPFLERNAEAELRLWRSQARRVGACSNGSASFWHPHPRPSPASGRGGAPVLSARFSSCRYRVWECVSLPRPTASPSSCRDPAWRGYRRCRGCAWSAGRYGPLA
jgi:hypothetical protein